MEVSSPELQKSSPGGGWMFPVVPRGGMAVWGEAAAACTLPTPKAISFPSESPIQHPKAQERSCDTTRCLSSASTPSACTLHPTPVKSRATLTLPHHDLNSACWPPPRTYVLPASSAPA